MAVASSTYLAKENLDSSVDSSTLSDLELTDNNGNVLVRFANGHVRTKYFNSANTTPVAYDSIFLNLKGKKIGFLGDSITYGIGASTTAMRYSSVFCQLAECTERKDRKSVV